MCPSVVWTRSRIINSGLDAIKEFRGDFIRLMNMHLFWKIPLISKVMIANERT